MTDKRAGQRNPKNEKSCSPDEIGVLTVEHGEKKFLVCADDPWCRSGIILQEDGFYTISASGKWTDKKYDTTPDGLKEFPSILNIIIRFFKFKRRCPKCNWFELIGAIDEDEGSYFSIGIDRWAKTPYYAKKTGELRCFANDLWSQYHNNLGAVQVTIKRVNHKDDQERENWLKENETIVC